MVPVAAVETLKGGSRAALLVYTFYSLSSNSTVLETKYTLIIFHTNLNVPPISCSQFNIRKPTVNILLLTNPTTYIVNQPNYYLSL